MNRPLYTYTSNLHLIRTMKEYPEPTGRWLDILEQVLLWIVAAALCYCVYLAVYFARIILEVA